MDVSDKSANTLTGSVSSEFLAKSHRTRLRAREMSSEDLSAHINSIQNR